MEGLVVGAPWRGWERGAVPMARVARRGRGGKSTGLEWRREGERGSIACGPSRLASRSTGWAKGHWAEGNGGK
jgi:hypothetical protein